MNNSPVIMGMNKTILMFLKDQSRQRQICHNLNLEE